METTIFLLLITLVGRIVFKLPKKIAVPTILFMMTLMVLTLYLGFYHPETFYSIFGILDEEMTK